MWLSKLHNWWQTLNGKTEFAKFKTGPILEIKASMALLHFSGTRSSRCKSKKTTHRRCIGSAMGRDGRVRQSRVTLNSTCSCEKSNEILVSQPCLPFGSKDAKLKEQFCISVMSAWETQEVWSVAPRSRGYKTRDTMWIYVAKMLVLWVGQKVSKYTWHRLGASPQCKGTSHSIGPLIP